MITDRFGGQHSSTSTEAVAAFEDAIVAVAAHQPIADTLNRALDHDPDICSATTLQGLGAIMLAKSADVARGKEIAVEAREKLRSVGGGTASERALVVALELAADGRMQAAADSIEDHLIAKPTDFLAVKLAHGLRFMCGQPTKMLATTATVLPSWTPDNGGYGFLLGCHAFGLEECGHYREAETTGRKGVLIEPADAWGLHAVSHVMEMNTRTDEGALWLEASRALWPKCNNFGFHLAWHLALFRLEQSNHDAVLDLYDKDIAPAPSKDFRDMANAASILWRLEQEGVQVGERWGLLREVAVEQKSDATYVFGALHFLLALVASGDHLAAVKLAASLQDRAIKKQGDQGRVAAEVGAEMAGVILSARVPGQLPATTNLVAIANKLQMIGGSHAQRDVFLRTLLMAAADNGDRAQLSALKRIRGSLRCSDKFIDLVERRIASTRASETQNELSSLASMTMFH